MRAKRLTVFVSIILCGGGLAMGQTMWQDYPDNPVIGVDDPGSWAPGGSWVSTVLHDGTTYHMWFSGVTLDDSGWIEPAAVGHATSPDGIAWTMDPANPVITPGDPGEWDHLRTGGCAVVYDGAQFEMWYEGSSEGPNDVGYATSPDGSTWTKYSGNPVMEHGPPGSWDDAWIAPTTVLVEDGTYRMWFHGRTDELYSGQIGYAESPDGITWTKWPDPVLEPANYAGSVEASFLFPSVIFDGTTYHMWHANDAPATATKVHYAYSKDGIEWTKHRGNPVHELADENIFSLSVLPDGDSWTMWYSHFGDDRTSSVSYATSDCCAGIAALDKWRFIPAAAVASGAQGAFYQTDVDVSNADTEAVEYQFYWMPRGENNTEATGSEIFSLDTGKSVRYANVLNEVFGLEPNSLGALLVFSTSEDLLLMSRTYNNPSGDAAGTFGQAIRAIGEDDVIRGGERKRILFGSENADFRFNVGCQNGRSVVALIQLELFAADGTSFETKMMLLRPWSNDQFNRIFEDYRPVNGYVDVWASSPDAKFYCYGSLLDNTTSDPTTIPPQ